MLQGGAKWLSCTGIVKGRLRTTIALESNACITYSPMSLCCVAAHSFLFALVLKTPIWCASKYSSWVIPNYLCPKTTAGQRDSNFSTLDEQRASVCPLGHEWVHPSPIYMVCMVYPSFAVFGRHEGAIMPLPFPFFSSVVSS